MFLFNFNIRNPWSNRFENLKSWQGRALIPNKSWEFEVMKTTDIFDFMINITHCQDHAGICITLGALGYGILFQICDDRHWNDEQKRWYEPGEEQ